MVQSMYGLIKSIMTILKKTDEVQEPQDYAIPEEILVKDSQNLDDSSSYVEKNSISQESIKHKNLFESGVGKMMSKFKDAKASGVSKDMLENLGHQVIVEMQKETIEKSREIKENSSGNYAKALVELQQKQQERVDDFKVSNGIGNSGAKKNNYVESITAQKQNNNEKRNSNEPRGV